MNKYKEDTRILNSCGKVELRAIFVESVQRIRIRNQEQLVRRIDAQNVLFMHCSFKMHPFIKLSIVNYAIMIHKQIFLANITIASKNYEASFSYFFKADLNDQGKNN